MMDRRRRDTILISAYETIAALAPTEPTNKFGHSPQSDALITVGLMIDRAWTSDPAEEISRHEHQPNNNLPAYRLGRGCVLGLLASSNA